MAYLPVLFVCAVVGLPNIHFAEARRNSRRLQDAQQEAARAGERERIARDLHDVLGHTLSLIVLKSELASKLATRDPARAIVEIADVERISREALAEVREAVRGYRSDGLAAEFGRARQTLDAAGIALEVDCEAAVALDPRAEQALTLVLREAVTNVVRHARARRCQVVLQHVPGAARLDVRDDGIGGAAREGTGLSAMRTRLAEVGGTLERDGSEGTRIRAIVPAARAARAAGAPS